jgi:hypothetical protein
MQQRLVDVLGPDPRVEIEFVDDALAQANCAAISWMASTEVVAAIPGSKRGRS